MGHSALLRVSWAAINYLLGVKKKFTNDFACFQLPLEDTPRIYTRLKIVVLKTGQINGSRRGISCRKMMSGKVYKLESTIFV